MHISEDHLQGHGHSHDELQPMSREEILKLLSYMLDHNRHHAEELHEVCHKLDAGGKQAAAKLIHDAVDAFSAGNELLAKALEALKA